jgi:hypothetical protein
MVTSRPIGRWPATSGVPMTTEIAVLNREAVALAADSAATYRDSSGGRPTEKIHTSANKIFSLSGSQPVGVMVYNAAGFVDVPWETVIKMFRRALGDRMEPTLASYERAFVDFLGGVRLVSAEEQQRFVISQAARTFAGIRDEVRALVQGRLEASPGVTLDAPAVLDLLRTQLAEARTDLESVPPIFPDHDPATTSFLSTYGDAIEQVATNVFGEITLDAASLTLVRELVAQILLRRTLLPTGSGVVIGGFGEDDIFPCLRHIWVNGVVDGRVRTWQLADTYEVAKQGAAIVPFAQTDMVEAFVMGVSPSYQRVIERVLADIVTGYPDALLDSARNVTAATRKLLTEARDRVSAEQLGKYIKELEQWRNERFVADILTIVASLPKDELGALAEALVNLTSLRRRMSRSSETVGGPVDVAVISKGDGLVWMRRKHYFDPALNPRYFANQYGRD